MLPFDSTTDVIYLFLIRDGCTHVLYSRKISALKFILTWQATLLSNMVQLNFFHHPI